MNAPSNPGGFLPIRVVVMGVSGCGKSGIGRRLAARLDIPYLEGDDYHPPENISRMAEGIALNDDDRRAWLLSLQARIRTAADREQSLVLTCSSLKRRYRDLLRGGDPNLIFVHLHGDRELIASRMQRRSGHFMPLTLLDSQFRDLEPLERDEPGLQLDVKHTPDELIDQIVQQFSAIGIATRD